MLPSEGVYASHLPHLKSLPVRTFLPTHARPTQFRRVLEFLETAQPRGQTDIGAILHEVADRIRAKIALLVSHRAVLRADIGAKHPARTPRGDLQALRNVSLKMGKGEIVVHVSVAGSYASVVPRTPVWLPPPTAYTMTSSTGLVG